VGSLNLPKCTTITVLILALLSSGCTKGFETFPNQSNSAEDSMNQKRSFTITSNPVASNITTSAATISWSLSEVATGQVQYGTSTSYDKISTPELSFNFSNHTQNISGLSAGTTYHYQVVSSNAAGAKVVSDDSTFSTISATPTAAPTPRPQTQYYGPGIEFDSLNNHQVAGVDVDYRFRATTSGPLKSLMWYNIHSTCYNPPSAGYSCGTGGIMHICIQTDDGTSNHRTTGVNLACVDNIAPLKSTFPVEVFPSPAVLTKGQLYHIHWHNTDPDPLNNFVSVDAMFVWNPMVPRQPTILDNDLAIFRGAVLQTRDTPIFQITYGDGTTQGQGYMEAWGGVSPLISGSSEVREQFTVSGPDRVVTHASFRLKRDSSSIGTSPLMVTLKTGAGATIEQGAIPYNVFPLGTTNDNSGNQNAWGTYTFTAPRTLVSGQSYQVVLSAASDTKYRAPPIRRGPSYGFSSATFFSDGYGQFSTDGGSNWVGFTQPGGSSNNTIADIQFYFTVTPSPQR
jgi:hypothetical protein